MFNRQCLVCLEKQNRINDLLSQIEMLRKMVSPSQDPKDLPLQVQEMDSILNASHEAINVDFTPEQAEALAILTGSYDANQDVI